MEETNLRIARAMKNGNTVQPYRKKARREIMTSFSDDFKAQIRAALVSSHEQTVALPYHEDYDSIRTVSSTDIAQGSSGAAEGQPPTESGTYHLVRQRHVGPRHGRGGRKRGPVLSERRQHVTPEITKLFARTLIDVCGGSITALLQAMKDSFALLCPGQSWTTDAGRFLTDLMTELGTESTKSMYEVIPAPYFAICIKLPYSQTGTSSLFPMDRHAICTWLGENGKPFCTCVGSTSFRIRLVDINGSSNTDASCGHARGVFSLIEQMRLCLQTSFTSTANIIMDLYARRYNTPLATYIHTRPRLSLTHDDKVAVISEISPGTTRTVQFTPVRILLRGSGGYVCAFCDTVLKAECHHTKVVRHLRKENTLDDERNEENDDNQDDSDKDSIPHAVDDIAEEGQWQEDHDSANFLADHKSHLPLSPVNCSRSLKVDRAIGDCAIRGEPYILTAPEVCAHCNASRNPKTLRKSEGIIMCTLGPCAFQLEIFNCSNEQCGLPIEAEGREHCVLIDKCTAATHVLLRRELIGVVMSNGTMNGRLRQYHSEVTSFIHAGIIPAYPPCRSVRSLHRLCTIMLKLMVLEPDRTLFLCSNCDEGEEEGRRRRGALCIDGINQGYLRRNQVALKNMSQACSSVPLSNTAFHGNSCRPLNTLLRRRQTISLLLNVIKGNSITIDKRNISDVAAAIRIVSSKEIPPQFCSQSICGRTFNDYHDDIGDNAILPALTKVTKALFHSDTILYRLMKPLDVFIRQCLSENSLDYLKELGALPRERPCNPFKFKRRVIKTLQESIHNFMLRMEGVAFSSIILNGVCWLPELRRDSSDTMTSTCWQDCLREIMAMYTMFMEGPVTQFITRSDIYSLRQVANLCKVSTSYNAWFPLLTVLNKPNILDNWAPARGTNFLASCRIVRAAAFNIVQAERTFSASCGRAAREGMGSLFAAAADAVANFYEYYDRINSNHSAVQYASTWNESDGELLRNLLRNRFGHQADVLHRNPFEAACISGFYFPSHPQLRPLPFNTDDVIPDRDLVPCTKNYTQNQTCYTPGSVTVSCFCPNTITYGIKVLSRDEGTKCILDTVISRFLTISDFIIYDFSCGLYQSAVHSLWWAIQNTRIVSDKFHAKNHTCSPGFFPNAYTHLDHANTVAHEQRNRGIAELCKSLRNSSQQFYIGLVAYHTIIMNIRAKSRSTQRYETRDSLLSDYDLEWCYYHCLEGKCSCCPAVV